MTSIQASFSQIPSRFENFIVVNSNAFTGWKEADIDFGLVSASNAGFLFQKVGNMVSARRFPQMNDVLSYIFPSVNSSNFSNGTLLKDMGKSIYFSVKGTTVQELRKVQVVLSSENEGVPPNFPNEILDQSNLSKTYGEFYISVFCAEPGASQDPTNLTPVAVARVG